jgi:hypothetical protein
MVVDNLIHDPARQANSGSFDLIQGGFVFIAGQSVLNGGTGRDTVEIGFGGDVNTGRFPTSSTCAGSRSSTCGTARSTACGLRCPTCSACPTKASPCSGSFRR